MTNYRVNHQQKIKTQKPVWVGPEEGGCKPIRIQDRYVTSRGGKLQICC